MRFRAGNRGPSATTVLIVANCAIFLLFRLLGPGWTVWSQAVFGLTEAGLRAGYFWQLVTHQFLHGGEVHLLVNMLALWFAGREVERALGKGRFLALYLGGGIAGGLAQVVFIGGGAPLVGASGSVCAVLLCLTSLYPDVPVTALVFFILPIRTKAKFVGIGLVAASLALWASGIAPMIGHWAHLGGFAFGYLFAKGVIWSERRQARAAEPPERPGPPGWNHPDSPVGVRQMVPGGGGTDALDRVLAKVLRRGIESLSREELAILENARHRRAGRARRW